MSDTEDYEAIRQKNIAERNEFMKQFLKDIGEDIEEFKKLEKNKPISHKDKENRTPTSKKRKRSSSDQKFTRTKSVRLEFTRKYNTRSGKRKLENGENEETDIQDLYNDKDIIVSEKKSSLKVMFPWSRPVQRDLDLMNLDFSDNDDDEEDHSGSDSELFRPKKKRVVNISKSSYDPSTIPSPDEITERMLKGIAVKATNKTYDAVNGTSCHQCRQKTKDTKTVCRSGECIGIRGQFCGPCLRGRYGESAHEALKDPHWACPPCRGLCNCSICRTKNGQRPTGILAPIAKEEGYNSVKDYLEACED
ncbi:cell division cycle-associated protein 7 [Copidosoma floridanum]|uniref:cell division cycle-associated protein 7 n=1 Tax=Copidosoma floridanum TaxID=29053 RepID=UPI0006C9B8C6|nr:cell division cycle-associated protein 7 [Copidosoma floridanum]